MSKDNNPSEFTSILSKIEVFAKSINSAFTEKIADVKLNKEKNKEKYDIGVDDIHAEYKNIPKRIGLITVGLGFLMIIAMTVMTVREQVSQVDKERKQADPKKLQEGEVDISIDEQGWKYYQGKRIDILSENTKKELNATREEMKKDSLLLQENVKKDLNETVSAVKGFVENIEIKLEDIKTDIAQQLAQQLNDVDLKIKENQEFMKNIPVAAPGVGTPAAPLFGGDSKLLPPSLNNLSTSSPIAEKKEVKIIYAKPDTDEYDYSDVEINDFEVAIENVSSSLYIDTNISTPEEPKLHIMKGLVNATLVTGINAPTFGGGSDKNPAPVLLSVDGSTFIANNEYEIIEDCFVAGSASGNVNTSKADILLTDISCSGYNKNGDRIKLEQPIKGWVIGEDGSFGLSGRLLDSSGKVITKMIALEIIQGMTTALVASSQPTNTVGTITGTSGTVQSYPAAAQGGLGQGVSKGLDHAYEHYSQILSGMYPTISVLAGKKVTIYLKGGEDITPSLYKEININEEIEVD
jgi:biopolymer transport protein ExbD